MINELYHLSKSLENCGIKVEKKHRWMQTPKKGAGFRVVLEEDGNIAKVEYVNKERIADMWNISPNKHSSFPVINLTSPIWKPGRDGDVELLLNCDKKKVKEQHEIIMDIVKNGVFEFNRIKDFIRRVQEFPQKELSDLIEDDAYNAFEYLIQATSYYKNEVKALAFVKLFSEKIVESMGNGEIDDISLIKEALFGKWNRKNNKFEESKITVLFDIKDHNEIDSEYYSIFSYEMQNYLNNKLFSKTDEDKRCAVCSLSDQKVVVETIMPEPNLPQLGPSFLMSMNKDIPCLRRYGKIGCDVFPLGKNISQKMYDAIQFITQEKRKYKTWISVPSGKKGKNDLLITYLEEMPEDETTLAALIGGDEEMLQSDFESLSSIVCDALKIKLPNKRYSILRLFLLHSVSKGQRTVKHSDGFTVTSLLNAVEKWKEGSQNVPPFWVMTKSKDEERKKHYPNAPYPASVFSLMQYQWLNNGNDRKDLACGRISDIYEIFFRSNISITANLLEMFLRRLSVFLIRSRTAFLHRSLNPWSHMDTEKRKKEILTSVAFLGILLSILGIKKEKYMKQSGYYVGRMFALADELHKQYCIHVRNNGDEKKNLPAQLLGNGLIRNSMDNPLQGLARLQERLMVYKAWADKVQGDQYKLVKWILKMMGNVSESLSELEIPDRTDDVIKAQILLGYLARSEKKQINVEGDNK